MDGYVLQEGVDALFILLYGRYWVERQLHAGKLVVLVFHVKGEHQRLPGGAGRPPLGRPAWGCGHLATVFAWTSLIISWGRYSLRGFDARSARSDGLPLAQLGPPLLRHFSCTLMIFPGWWIDDSDTNLH